MTKFADMSAVIVANGEFPHKEYPLYLLKTAEYILCCDASSGLKHLERLGIAPDLIVGDMDSCGEKTRRKLADRLVQIEEQDDNDLAKAMRVLRERRPDIKEIHILGAGGRNEAHAVGNLGWLMEWEMRYDFQKAGVCVDMVSDYSTAFAVSRDISLEIGEGRKISFFTCDPTLKICSEGLHWPLDQVVFDAWWKASLNRADSDSVTLRFSHRAPLLVILD